MQTLDIKLVSSLHLDPELEKQYKHLLQESRKDRFFDIDPTDKEYDNYKRQVVILGNKVVGAFEFYKSEFEGKSYFRTNRPYVLNAYRGKGIMLEALSRWYEHRRPAMAWIEDKNISSIRLFQNVGFRKKIAVQDGYLYFLT